MVIKIKVKELSEGERAKFLEMGQQLRRLTETRTASPDKAVQAGAKRWQLIIRNVSEQI